VVFGHLWVKKGIQVEGLTLLLIKLAGALIWPLEDFCCLTTRSCSWPFFLLPSCLLTPFKLLVISVIIRVPTGVLLRELALRIGLGI
jgi:hypothetical protein